MANKLIKDEFSTLRVSRQRKWQLRQAKRGRCMLCSDARDGDSLLCKRHRERQLKRMRKQYRQEVG